MQAIPHQRHATDKIWLRSASRLQRYSSSKVWMATDDHGSSELKNCQTGHMQTSFFMFFYLHFAIIRTLLMVIKCLELLDKQSFTKISFTITTKVFAYQKCSNYSKKHEIFLKLYARDQSWPEGSPNPRHL